MRLRSQPASLRAERLASILSFRKVAECRTLDPCKPEEMSQRRAWSPSAQLIDRHLPSVRPAVRFIPCTPWNLTISPPQTVVLLPSIEPAQENPARNTTSRPRFHHNTPYSPQPAPKRGERDGKSKEEGNMMKHGNKRERKPGNCKE